MKLKLSILFLLMAQISWTQQGIDSSRIVRVLSFNILHGATTKGDFDLDRIAKVITDVRPDFVALQEVDYRTRRALDYDLVTELGWRSKLIPLFGRAMYYDGGEYGEGILSNYSLLSSRKVDLSHSSGNEPRAALEITCRINDWDTIAFIGTHFDHTTDETDRIAQAKEINKIFSNNTLPSILAGDLNAEPGSNTIAVLEEMWIPSYNPHDIQYTYPSDEATKKIDYIMFYPEKRWRVLERRVICDSIASDHCAYLVVLELLDRKE